MDQTIDALRTSFDAFSRRLEAKLKNFKATGQLTDESEIAKNLRKRYEETKTKLDLAVRAGVGKAVRHRSRERCKMTHGAIATELGRFHPYHGA